MPRPTNSGTIPYTDGIVRELKETNVRIYVRAQEVRVVDFTDATEADMLAYHHRAGANGWKVYRLTARGARELAAALGE